MDITGSYTFAAPPERIWNLLMDPQAIASCIPGCDRLEPDGDDRYRAAIRMGMAAISGNYEGTVTISEKVPPQSYRLTFAGQGLAGFVKGDAVMLLRAEGDGTVVAVTATVHTGGTIARLGQRLIGSAAKMMQDHFFSCLRSKL